MKGPAFLARELSVIDSDQTKTEVQLNSELIQNSIEALSLRPKLVRRNGGGFTYVDPIQVIAPTGDNSGLMVRVKFTDIRIQKGKPNEKVNLVKCSKLVTPNELRDESHFDRNGKVQLIDLGKGVIPVRVFDRATIGTGNQEYAFFVHYLELQEISESLIQTTKALQIYAVPKEVIRLLGQTDSQHLGADMRTACTNYHKLKNQSGPVIPEGLKIGDAVMVPCGAMTIQIEELLKGALVQFLTNV